MDARTTEPGDATARRGLLFVLGAIALLPVVIAIVSTVPRGARGIAFELGLLCGAAAALWGGALGRQALQAGTHRTLRAYTAAILGLVVGITMALLCISAAIDLLA